MSTLIEKNLNYINNLEKSDSSKEKIKEIKKALDKEKLIIISWLEWTWKTEIVSQFISEEKLEKKTLYFNTELDIFSKIKDQKGLERMLDFYKKDLWEPEVIILEKIQKIDDVNIFIKDLYLSGKYKIILIWNNIKISSKPEIEILPNYLTHFSNPLNKQILENTLFFWSLTTDIENINQKKSYLNLNLSKIMLEDIFYTFDVRNIDLYKNTLAVLATNNDFISLRDFQKFLKRYNVKISLATTIDYVDYSLSSKLIKRISNFDLKLDKEIAHKNKYFFTDLWIKNSLLLYNIDNHTLTENYVYNILSYMWYTLYGWINWVFNFGFIIFWWNSEIKSKNIKYLVHVTNSSNREDIQWEARKLVKTWIDCPMYIIAKNTQTLKMRKNYRWVDIVELEDFIKDIG